MMISLQLNHLTNISGFISTSVSPIIIEIGRMIHLHALMLTSIWWLCHHLSVMWKSLILYSLFQNLGTNHANWHGRPTCTKLTLYVIITTAPLGYETNKYGLIWNFANPVTSKLRRVVDQHQLSLGSRQWWSHHRGITTIRHRDLLLVKLSSFISI